MGFIDGIEHKAGDYLFSVGAKRVAAAIAGFVVGKLASGTIAILLNKYGVSIDPATLSTEINGAVIAGAVALHDWLRVKYPEAKWL